MELGSKEIIIIFNGNDNSHKEAIAYAHILSDKVKQYDLTKMRLSARLLGDLARRLHVEIFELMDIKGALFRNLRLKAERLDNETAMVLFIEYPELLKSPILLMNNHTIFIESKHDIMNLAMA